MVTVILLLVLSLSLVPAQHPTFGMYSFSSYANSELEIRHCDYQCYATPATEGNDDFTWNVVAALNGNSSDFSFQSTNYPDHYITVITDPSFKETGRLGVTTNPNVDDASFSSVAGLASSDYISFISRSRNANYTGKYITVNTGVISGGCSYSAPAGDLYLDVGSTHAQTATWKLITNPNSPSISINANTVTHTLNKQFMGCHSDSGYVHQPRGLYAQMIFGDCFEEPWNNIVDSGTTAKIGSDSTVLFNNKASMKIDLTAGSGFAGVSNRGLGNEGLVFAATRDYDGYVYVRAATNVKVSVFLDNYETNTVLASTTFTVNAGTSWQVLNFNFTASNSTTCVGITSGSDPAVSCGNMGPGAGHICVKCGGQFRVGITGVGTVNIGYAYLQPGSWGRFKDLPVLLSGVTLLQSIGVTSIRQGGTFSQGVNWKDWRGPPTQRPSMGWKWGASLISGWGLFEMTDLCNAAGWTPIITLSKSQSPQDWSDLVEYCYGDNSTTWGATRYKDGHPNPYVLDTFELGNEEYNADFVSQVQAMETKAKSLGKTLYYMFPTNQGLNSSDQSKATSAGLPINRLMPDIHVTGGGAVETAEADFNASPNFQQSAINCETNAGIHTHQRAMQESQDLMDWFNVVSPVEPRLRGRTASFCMERSGHYDNFDQGITFFLPNMTWIQPPGYVHQMITQTWADQALALTSTTKGVQASAQKTSDNSKLYVRLVNYNNAVSTVTLIITGFNSNPTVNVLTLANSNLNAANTPGSPTNVSPRASTLTIASGGGDVTLPVYSFTVLEFTAA
jgi:hypothetical protein